MLQSRSVGARPYPLYVGDDLKRCVKCDTAKPLTDFWANRKRADGLCVYCKPCQNESKRASYWRHVERNREKMKARYGADPEPYKRRAQNWQDAHREQYRKAAREAARRRGAAEKERKRQWRIANKEWTNAATARRRAWKLNAPHVPFSVEQLVQRLAMFSGCWICGAPPEAVDHVKPLSKGGWHALANLRPICTSCNTRKRDHWPLSVVREVFTERV